MKESVKLVRLLALALLLTLGLAACGPGEGGSDESAGSESTEGVSDAEDTADAEVADAAEEVTGGATGGNTGGATGGAPTGGSVSGAAAGAAGAAAGAAASALPGNETGGATGGAATGGAATGGNETGGVGDVVGDAAGAATGAVAGAAGAAVNAVTGDGSDETGGATGGGATGGAATGGAATGGAAAGQPGDQVTVNLSNESNTAWIITSVDGGDGVAEVDTQNPTLSLTEGQRYVFELSTAGNPIDLRAEDGTFLLAQGQPQGTLEDNSEVNFADEGSSVAFTLTPELAEQLATYSSTLYPAMSGTVEVSGP